MPDPQHLHHPNPDSDTVNQPIAQRLVELIQVFLKLGAIGFGGPQAHIALQNDEAVERRGWITQEQFTEGIAICEMLPGPASTQMGIYIGYLRAGQIGALIAGLCFIAPAFLILLLLSWAYFQFQSVPQVEFLFLGVSPIVTAIILGFCWKLGKRTLRHWSGVGLAIAAFVSMLVIQLNILLVFILAGVIGIFLYGPKGWIETQRTGHPPGNRNAKGWVLPLLPALSPLATSPAVTADVLSLSSFWGLERIQEFLLPLLGLFLRTGSFVFGGGLVIIPLLEFDVVDRLQWLTREEFINGVALGQLTPGPVVLTSAFIGYKVAGVLGALVAAIGIFTPSFAFIMLAAPLLSRIRSNPWVKAFLRGVTSAVVGAIAAATIPLAQTALVQETVALTLVAIGLAIAALVALIRYKRPTWQLVLCGALAGLAIGSVVPSS